MKGGTGNAAAVGPRMRLFGPLQQQVPVVGQGTWNMEREPEESVDALRHGIELGLTHIDTAELYGDGAVETLVGRAIRGRRERVFLVSKVKPENATRRGLIDACERSLRRLATDRLDVYLLHWVSSHPIQDTVAAFEELVAAGKIRYWGVSNFDEVELAEITELTGSGRIVCNQVMHHLGRRDIEHAVVPFCQSHDIAVVGYSPFGTGAFPPAVSGGREALSKVAADCGATPRQVTLAFLAHMSGGFTIPKASRREHVEDNAAAARLELPPEAIVRLNDAFPVGRRVAGVPIS